MHLQFVQRILTCPNWVKRTIILGVDVFLCFVTYQVALLLRIFDIGQPLSALFQINHLYAFLFSAGLCLLSGLFFGAYNGVFRRSDSTIFLILLKAGAMYSFGFVTLIVFFGLAGVPRSIGLVQPIFLYACIALSRSVARILLSSSQESKLKAENAKNILIYGAGDAGALLPRSMSASGWMNAVGYIDDDKSLQGRYLAGLKIFDPKETKELIKRLNVDEIILALPSVPKRQKANILEKLRMYQVAVRTIPTQLELLNHQYEVQDFRALLPEEILGREAKEARPDLLALDIKEQIVLVTGAGGSIGSELCRQIIKQEPVKLILFEQSEFALYTIHKELIGHLESNDGLKTTRIHPVLGSVIDEHSVTQMIAKYGPSTIYHAAAYKHVALVESNSWAAIRNNVFGTLTVAKAAVHSGVNKFVLVSTDKAVRPKSIMGASKRLAELVVQSLAVQGSKTTFAMVRFGNVLNSSGSVVPIFQKQLQEGGPITVTDPEVTRYFMTIEEAAQLVIQAGALSSAKQHHIYENAPLYLLDMGEPIKILALAKQMIELSGLTVYDKLKNPKGDVEINFVGLGPGEKLFEELLIDNEAIPTSHENIYFAREAAWSSQRVTNYLQQLKQLSQSSDDKLLREFLAKEFTEVNK